MKKLLLSIIAILFFCGSEAKTIVIPKKGGEWYFTSMTSFPAQPGDTVIMESEYYYIGLENINGLPNKHIVFIGVPQKTKVGYLTNGNSMVTQKCSYLTFINIEVGNQTDGKFNEQGWNIQSSHNLTIINFVVKNSKIGFFTNPATGHYPNLIFKNGVVKNIGDSAKKSFDEAFYIGRTSGQSLSVNSFPNLIIENVDLIDIGGDGFQIANGVNILIKDCRVIRCGKNMIDEQWNAYLFGGGTSGTAENNYAEDCSGTPFLILGTGIVIFRNNVSVRSGFGATNQDIFYIRQSFPTLTVGLYGNKADKKTRNWVKNEGGVKIDSSGNQFGVYVPTVHIVPTRVDSIAKSLSDSLIKVENDKYEVMKLLYQATKISKDKLEEENKKYLIQIENSEAIRKQTLETLTSLIIINQ